MTAPRRAAAPEPNLSEPIPLRAVYPRLDVHRLTPRTAPPYGTITHNERSGWGVLLADDGSGKLLLGPLGVNYYQDGPADEAVVYLRRHDMPPRRKQTAARTGRRRRRP